MDLKKVLTSEEAATFGSFFEIPNLNALRKLTAELRKSAAHDVLEASSDYTPDDIARKVTHYQGVCAMERNLITMLEKLRAEYQGEGNGRKR